VEYLSVLWNPAAGMRRGEGTSVDEALRGLKINDEPGEVKIE